MVKRIGERFALPIEVLPFALASVRTRLTALGLEGPIRTREAGDVYHTDNGFVVIDAAVQPGADVRSLNESLAAIDGVLGHGLFLTEADEVFVESKDRSDVKRLTRKR
jgi:ribose 5-phosphate isomerase A